MEENFVGLTEKTVKCPHCQQITALEETDPNTNVTSWLCVNCGYTSNTLYRKNTKELRNVLKNSPQVILDSKIYDEERELTWILTIINMPSKGVIFPVISNDKLIWNYSYIINIPKEEQYKYPIPNQDNQFFKQRLTDTPKQFNVFYDALKEMGAIVSDLSEIVHE